LANDKLTIVDEVDLHRIAVRWRVPNKRQLVAGFKLKALWPRLNRHVDGPVLLIDEGLLC
jgi:hypothetical protein